MKACKVLFCVWGALAAFLWISSGDIRTFLCLIGALISGASALIFWKKKKSLAALYNKIQMGPKKKFVLAGSLCAAWVELEFWILGAVTGAAGVSASPNLALDLLITMPWYVAMIWLLSTVESKYSYSFFGILMLGGIYDFFTDGILAKFIISGQASLENSLLLLVSLPIFVLAYSFIVLPPSYLLRNDARFLGAPKARIKNYFFALLPLLALIPYGIALRLMLF